MIVLLRSSVSQASDYEMYVSVFVNLTNIYELYISPTLKEKMS